MKYQIKRKFGIVLLTIGLIIVASLLGIFFWVIVDRFEHSGNLSFFWQKEFYYILPSFLFLIPGIYITLVGRKMVRGGHISLMAYIEISFMLIIGIALIYLNLRADSDYVDQAKQVPPACHLDFNQSHRAF